MAYKLIWSPLSRDDLRDIVRFISRDSPHRAQAFALRLMAHAEMLQEQPEAGRVVPEQPHSNIHEISIVHIASFTAWIMTESSSRFHEYGMRHLAIRSFPRIKLLMPLA